MLTVFLRKPDLILRRAAHHGLPPSCGRSHPSGLWQLAVPFSAAAFHSEENDKDRVILNDFVNKILYSEVATENLKTLEKESSIEHEMMFLRHKDLLDSPTPTTEVF